MPIWHTKLEPDRLSLNFWPVLMCMHGYSKSPSETWNLLGNVLLVSWRCLFGIHYQPISEICQHYLSSNLTSKPSCSPRLSCISSTLDYRLCICICFVCFSMWRDVCGKGGWESCVRGQCARVSVCVCVLYFSLNVMTVFWWETVRMRACLLCACVCVCIWVWPSCVVCVCCVCVYVCVHYISN